MDDTKSFGMFEAMGRSLSNPSDDDVYDGLDPIVKIPQDSTDDDKDDNLNDPSKNNDDVDSIDNSIDDNTDDNTDDNVDDVDDDNNDVDDKVDVVDDKVDLLDDNKDKSKDDLAEDEELAAFEGEWIGTIQDKLYEKFDWQYGEDEEKINTVDGMAEYLDKLIQENSQPMFANNEIAKLNDFVNEGGDLTKYFESRYKDGVDLNSLDLTSKSDQELAVREFFQLQGADKKKIDKKIEAYDETGILEDEADYALEYLKNYREKESEKLLLEQKKINEDNQNQQQKFFDDVTSSIKSKKDIMGSTLNPKRKSELIEAIFKTDKNGLTRFQREYQTNPVEATILSAYAALYKDELIKNINKKAGSDAARNIKKKFDISKQKRMKSSGNIDSGDDGISSFTGLSRMMSKPN